MTSIVDKLNDLFEAVATCHCGSSCKDHSVFDNHTFHWNLCPDSVVIKSALDRLKLQRRYIQALTSEIKLWREIDNLPRDDQMMRGELIREARKIGEENDALAKVLIDLNLEPTNGHTETFENI